MSKHTLARVVEFLAVLACAGLALGQESPASPRSFDELFEPDASSPAAQPDTGRVAELSGVSPEGKTLVLINTATNQIFVTRGEKIVFRARCSTGKGTTLTTADATRTFVTPKGDFVIQSKEEHPVWVPPDWYFVEEARKKGLGTVALEPGGTIDLGDSENGFTLASNGGFSATRRLEVRGNTIVEVSGRGVRELPPGKLIRAPGAVVIPPYGTPQRKFDRVLGAYRINFGGGFGIHGTNEPQNIGRSVTHGCVRLGDEDIRTLYSLVNVGGEVVIF